MANDYLKYKLLAAAVEQVKEESRAADRIWFSLSGKIACEVQRLYEMGYNVQPITLIRELKERLENAIETERENLKL